MSDTNTQTAGTTSPAGSGTDSSSNNPALNVNLGELDVTGQDGSASGFDLTPNDTNNPEAFGTDEAPIVEPEKPARQETASPVEEVASTEDTAAASEEVKPAATPTGEDLAKLVRETLATELPAAVAKATTAPAEEPRLTVEQIDEKFKVVRLKPEDMTALGLDSSNAAAKDHLETLLHSAARMGAEIGAAKARTMIEKLQADIAPVTSRVTQQANQETAAAVKTQFYTKYADLEAYPELVTVVAAQVRDSGFAGKNSLDAVIDKIGITARALVDKVKTPGGTASASATSTSNSQAQQTKPTAAASKPATGANTTHRMTTLSGGGQGGASTGAKAATAKSDPTWNVWDD